MATGFVMELPPGIECQVRPRSGLAARSGVTLPNSPGTIDPDYRGEVRVLLQNGGPVGVTIRRGERIAQLVFARFEAPGIVGGGALGDRIVAKEGSEARAGVDFPTQCREGRREEPEAGGGGFDLLGLH